MACLPEPVCRGADQIAMKELREKKIPFTIRRYLPDGALHRSTRVTGLVVLEREQPWQGAWARVLLVDQHAGCTPPWSGLRTRCHVSRARVVVLPMSGQGEGTPSTTHSV
eukprot:scaffold111_cov404-Prasinococcus_capsulatus_cf.AAC.25